MERLKKLRKKLAEKAGFTLVELIVVIAILGILAAVAVPAYTGYVERAREASDYAQLDAIKTAVVAAVTEETALTGMVEVESISITDGQDPANVTYNTDQTVNISDFYPDTFSFASDNSQATWSADTQTWTLS